jgi:hypothetical protein
MIEIRFDRPILNKNSPEQNIALIDTWIAQTTDKLNYIVQQYNKEIEAANERIQNQQRG